MSLSNKAVFLDRDGTINVDKNYLYKIEDFVFLPGVLDALKKLQDAGYKLFVMTNQSGIARGFYSEDDYQKLTDWMLSELKKVGVVLSGVYYCPHLPDASVLKYKVDCECRKPKLGMFNKAVNDFHLDLNASFAVGDKERDLAICKSAQTKGILLYSGQTLHEENIYKIKGGLAEAAKIILNEEEIA